MPHSLLEKFFQKLLEKMTDRSFLKKARYTKRDMLALIREENWKSHTFSILSQENISCRSVLDMCQTVMKQFEEEPEEGWLTYIYRYLVTGLYPEQSDHPEQYRDVRYQPAIYFYLETLRLFLQWEAEQKEFDHLKDFIFVSEEDIKNFASEQEYRLLLQLYQEQYIYEMKRIGREITAFNILAHIAGVHFVAMHVARQLHQAGVPVDLGIVSGAALGHDIGKFGCRSSESDRVPYLHYYYTDQWFLRNNMPSIGHVAVNHSAWDLELENLPVESLILIYADFRVKNKYRNAEEYKCIPSRETIEFFTLKQAFDVILNKLDNVDSHKYKRYSNVYAKLHDFETYMEGLGVDTSLTASSGRKVHHPDPALRNAQQVIESFKHLAVDHNIRLMSKISDETSFGNILEAARSEKNWKNLRAYINIFTEYFTYMTQSQKMLTLDFLYELLMHKEGDIRRQGADLIGRVIASFDVKYRKELPAGVILSGSEMSGIKLWQKYIHMILFPDHKVTDQHKRWIGYALKIIVQATLYHCSQEERQDYLEVLLQYVSDNVTDDLTVFILLDAMSSIPLSHCSKTQLEHLAHFASSTFKKSSVEIKVNALNFLRYAGESMQAHGIHCAIVQDIIFSDENDEDISITYLKYCILHETPSLEGYDHMQAIQDIKTAYDEKLFHGLSSMPALFLTNLKLATPWVLKIVNIELLLEMLQRGIGDVLHVAAHLSNLIKVSERVAVRHRAGEALLSIAPLLSFDQCNEIVIDLYKGLEIGDYAVSKYIPEYLGVLSLHLPPHEMDEMLDHTVLLLKNTNEKTATGALNTLGVLLEHYTDYKSRFPEPEYLYEKRKQAIWGMLLNSLANYNDHISQEAFLVIGKSVFGSSLLTMQDLYGMFKQIYKKLLILISRQEADNLAFFNNAAALNHIYRFISNYTFEYGGFSIENHKRVAYFPGTFDPFSLSHKGIIREIRDLGFEVFLALDEFSWSKRTQPRLIRWQIANMSVADEMDVYLFPDDMPVNISNKKDLSLLRNLFADRELYFVAGSDVIMNASAYKAPPEKGDIHDLNHVVFKRSTAVFEGDAESEIIRERVHGQLIELTLPVHLEDISSTIIRDHIDLGRDISNLIDPLAQSYIYDLGLYLREPQYKTILKTRSIRFTYLPPKKTTAFLHDTGIPATQNFESKVITMRNEEKKESANLSGFSLYHEITTSDLYDEFGSSIVSEYVRSQSVGKIVVIRKIDVPPGESQSSHIQFLLTETLAECLKNNFQYCLFCDQDQADEKVIEALRLQGFSEIPGSYEGSRIYAVSMGAPIVLINDVAETLKPPLSTHPHVQAVIENSHRRLQKALVLAYPGQLVLSFDIGIMHHGIVNKVTHINSVPPDPLPVRKLGAKICVPFGKILRGVAVPNTVTKSLHTEKMFDARVRRFRIEAYPFFSPLANQIRTIKSFGRKVILVDDILHKGYRLKELDPLFKQERLDIDRIVVGIMSGRGRDLMHIQNRKAESVYYIPNLRLWFTESTLYPFVGGDSIKRENMMEFSAPPSINLILPYVSPGFIRGASLGTLFELSMTCLENTKELLVTLETEYRRLYERNLTLNRLGEVILYPRYPDTGSSMKYDFNLPPSVYIENDIEKLSRLWGLIR